MSDKKEYTGFTSYLVNRKITDDFIKDFEYWMRRYYRQWSLFTEYDDFKAQCWEALLDEDKGLSTFNPEVATIQTFCISRINNECWRIYMKNKGIKPENDIDDPAVNCNIAALPSIDVSYFNAFSRYAYGLGVRVDLQELWSDYHNGEMNDSVKAFSWWYLKEKYKESGGENR